MKENTNVESDLRQLGDFDRWLVVTYWSMALWRQRLRFLPLPGKLGLVHALVIFAVLSVAPGSSQAPPLFAPLLWAAAYSFSLSISMLLPRRRATQ